MKKILTYIFITLFILVASYTIIFPHTAHATFFDISGTVIETILATIGNVIMVLVSKILWLAGILLNYSLKWTLNISALVEQIPAITLAWKTVRDFATMFFIFLIIYQAISMILGLDGLGTKKLLVNIVIAGLLINFSLFFTKVIIDASNVIALQFYNAMTPDKTCADGCLSDIFMQQLWIQTTLDYNQPTQLAGGAPTGIVPKSIFMTTIMGSIVMLIAAFIFFAAACLFAIRIVVLIILMALSPLAYIGGILPGTKSYADQWWDTLNNQAIFAPAYLLVTYIGIRILSDPTFKKVLNGGSEMSPTFNQAFSGGAGTGASSVVVVLNFLIVIIFLVAGLIIANKLGVQGASTLKGWGNSLKKWGQGAVTGGIGRNTLGLGARFIADSQTFKNIAARNPSLGTLAAGGLSKVSGASYGGTKGGYDAVRKGKEKARVDLGKKLFDDEAAEKAKEAHLASGATEKQAEQAGKEAGQARQEKYLGNLSRPNIIMGNKGGVYAPWNRAMRKSAAKALRKEMKKGSKEKLLEELVKDTKGDEEPKEEKPKKE